MRLLADIAVGVLHAVGLAQADVVEFSHGGAVAQQMAVGHPTRVNRLVLLSTSCGVGAMPGRYREVSRKFRAPHDRMRWPEPDFFGLL
jgi:poly(3-hydroxyoctanoate) depolymerase